MEQPINPPRRINFFTITGHDLWVVDKVRTMVDLRNAVTGEVVTVEKGDERYQPADIMVVKDKKAKATTPAKTKKQTQLCLKKYGKKKHKGIIYTDSGKFQVGYWEGKFQVGYWDRVNKVNVNLGTYDTLPEALSTRKTAIEKAELKRKKSAKKTFAEIDKSIAEKKPQKIVVTDGTQVGDFEGA